MLLSRRYNKNVVNSAIERALRVERSEALKKVTKKKNDRVMFTVTFNPRLPSISNIVNKHYKTMTMDLRMKKMFPSPPMIAFRQPGNLKKTLCRAKLPPKRVYRAQRTLCGTQPCNNWCKMCPHTIPGKNIVSHKTKEKVATKGLFNCNTQGVIYLLSCEKCHIQYIGQSGRRIMERVREHLNSIDNNKGSVGEHFNSKGHNKSFAKFQVIEKVSPNTTHYLLEREEFWIKRFATKHPFGLNQKD